MKATAHQLERFVKAQAQVFDTVVAELGAAAKHSHWIWFVFPQLRGLGRPSTAQFCGVESATEALAYWRHVLLGPRLKTCVELVLAAPADKSAHDIFDSPDDLKLRSCLTLFRHVAPEEHCFSAALERFYGGEPDERTMELLALSSQ